MAMSLGPDAQKAKDSGLLKAAAAEYFAKLSDSGKQLERSSTVLQGFLNISRRAMTLSAPPMFEPNGPREGRLDHDSKVLQHHRTTF